MTERDVESGMNTEELKVHLLIEQQWLVSYLGTQEICLDQQGRWPRYFRHLPLYRLIRSYQYDVTAPLLLRYLAYPRYPGT